MLAIPSNVHMSYRLEKRKCGQARCKKCHNGGPDARHRAYWYAYWKVRTVTGEENPYPAMPEHLSLPWLHSRVTAKTEFALCAYAYAAEWWQVSQKCSTSQTLSAPIPERMDVRRSSAERMENVRTGTKTRLTWSLTILLALAAIATSVTYVVSKHLAQDAPHRLRQIALITGPTIPPRGLWAFDIGFVDDQSQVYYLADASNASVDMIDTRTNTLIGQIGGFSGFHGSRETQGPGGVLVDDLGQLWASDGDSTVKVIDLLSRTIVATLYTGGTKRADEMAYDPQDQILVVTNGSDAVPFATFISVTKRAIVGKLVFANAGGGLEAPVFDAETHLFYLSVPANKQYPGGAVAVVDPVTQQLVREYPLPACNPSGIALDPANQELLLGCSGHPVIVSASTGRVVATILQTSGCDEVWYDRSDQRYYLAAFTNPTGPALSVVDATTGAWVENVATVKKAHSVAVDPLTNHIFVPETGRGIVVYADT